MIPAAPRLRPVWFFLSGAAARGPAERAVRQPGMAVSPAQLGVVAYEQPVQLGQRFIGEQGHVVGDVAGQLCGKLAVRVVRRPRPRRQIGAGGKLAPPAAQRPRAQAQFGRGLFVAHPVLGFEPLDRRDHCLASPRAQRCDARRGDHRSGYPQQALDQGQALALGIPAGIRDPWPGLLLALDEPKQLVVQPPVQPWGQLPADAELLGRFCQGGHLAAEVPSHHRQAK